MRIIAFLWIAFCLLCSACGEVSIPEPTADYMADSDGNPLLMDFNIPLTSINNPDMPFSTYSQQLLMIYYFGPFCPYCQRNYGGIQRIAKEYEHRGLASIAVSVGSVSKSDILTFIEEQEGSIPFFQDSESKFGRKYGDGYVPRLYIVSPAGKIILHKNTEGGNLENIKSDIEKFLPR